MNERIKKLRKELDLTQQKFADRIGIKGNAISQYESGRNEPIDAVVSLICREFNVNETWLRTGEGEMFQQVGDDEALKRMIEDLSISEDKTMERLIRAYWQLSDSGKAGFRELLDNLVAEYEGGPGKEPIPAAPEQTQPATTSEQKQQAEPDLAGKVADLERQNKELAAKVAAMEEEDARMEAAAELSVSTTEYAGVFEGRETKK